MLMKYILITFFVVGIFILWEENQNLKKELKITTDKFKTIEIQNQQLKKSIAEKNKFLEKNATLQKIKMNQSKIEKQNKQNNIVTTLQEEKNKYLQTVMPKIHFDDILLDLNKTKEDTKEKGNIKINPEVFLDKDTRKLDGAKIIIEKKF